MADSVSPSASPSISPSPSPSVSFSASPSKSPSKSPSASPSVSPSPVASTEVAYTLRERLRLGKKHLAFVYITFGGTSNTLYTTGGIPLTVNDLGMTSIVNAVVILESNGGTIEYEWDRSANTIRMFAGATHIELSGNITVLGATTLELMVIGY